MISREMKDHTAFGCVAADKVLSSFICGDLGTMNGFRNILIPIKIATLRGFQNMLLLNKRKIFASIISDFLANLTA